MEKLREAGIILNKSKCNFFKDEIKILGSIVSKGIIKADPDKIARITQYKRPGNIKELRSFLGLLNYCRGFIPNLAGISEPLNRLLRGRKKGPQSK